MSFSSMIPFNGPELTGSYRQIRERFTGMLQKLLCQTLSPRPHTNFQEAKRTDFFTKGTHCYFGFPTNQPKAFTPWKQGQQNPGSSFGSRGSELEMTSALLPPIYWRFSTGASLIPLLPTLRSDLEARVRHDHLLALSDPSNSVANRSIFPQ
jgi:hypothetical protein